MNRYDDFLSKFISKYLSNPLISEIIITDETGDDAKKISEAFDDPKLKVFTNEKRLGAIFNKDKAMRLATNEWIAIIDSDNFTDIDYFIKAKEFIEKNNPSKESILSPVFTSKGFNSSEWINHPGFDHKKYAGIDLTKDLLKSLDLPTRKHLSAVLNMGNYIINKFLVNNVTFDKEPTELITNGLNFPGDALYYTTMLFEQFSNLHYYFVLDMSYMHSIHQNSYYMTTSGFSSAKSLQSNIENRFININ